MISASALLFPNTKIALLIEGNRGHHIAFKAHSRNHVDELYIKVCAIGAQIIDEPQIFPQDSPNYYEFFFFDTEGIKFEVVFDKPVE